MGSLKQLHMHAESLQSCPTLCDPMDCGPPGSSVHGILQARILKWVAISFSRRSSWPRNQTRVSCIAGRFFTNWAGLPNPGIEPRSSALQVDSLPSEPPGKPKNTRVGSLSLLQGNLPDSGIEPESPALQADSLPAEQPGMPVLSMHCLLFIFSFFLFFYL